MKNRIPERNRDLRRYAARNKWLPLALYAGWLVIFLSGALAYNAAHRTYRPERLIIGWKLVIWMAVAAVLGFFLFHVRKAIMERTYEGIVERSGLSHTYTASTDPGSVRPFSYDFRTQTYLIVRTDEGKRRRIRFEQKPGFYLYYYEGTHLCHFAGLPYPVCDPARTVRPPHRTGAVEREFDDLSGGCLCAACGHLNDPDPNARCVKCGHSLIDPADLWGNGSHL